MADQPSAELEKLNCKYEPQAEAPLLRRSELFANNMS